MQPKQASMPGGEGQEYQGYSIFPSKITFFSSPFTFILQKPLPHDDQVEIHNSHFCRGVRGYAGENLVY
jgi:hypothetical protein